LDQYGVRVVWADPVTGSSFTPASGKKQRDTKSYFVPLAETMSPLESICLSISKLISRFLIESSESRITKKSSLPLYTSIGLKLIISSKKSLFSQKVISSLGKSRN
jgi:hypothetical protein